MKPSNLTRIENWFRAGFEKVRQYFQQVKPAEPTPQVIAPVQGQVKARPAPRLQPYDRGIQVKCASCGVLHELEVVCHVCGGPLCDDSQHCRLKVHHRHLERTVVVCPTCRPKAQYIGDPVVQ